MTVVGGMAASVGTTFSARLPVVVSTVRGVILSMTTIVVNVHS